MPPGLKHLKIKVIATFYFKIHIIGKIHIVMRLVITLWIDSRPKTSTICAFQFQVATSLDSFPIRGKLKRK